MTQRVSDSVLELRRLAVDVIGCFASKPVLDALEADAQLAIRVATDELLLLGDRNSFSAIEAKMIANDSGSIAFDLTSAYALWALRGDGRSEAFCRLSEIRLPDPPAMSQGLIARMPAKVIVRAEELLLLVPSVVSHSLSERLLTACADLHPMKGSDLVPETEALA